MARQDILQIVVFATLLGVAAAHVGTRAGPFVSFVDSSVTVLFKLTDYVMSLTPLGVFGAMAGAVSHHGIGVLGSYTKLVGSLYAALVVFALLVFVPALKLARVPVLAFFRTIREPFLIAFSTASSEAALPRALERIVQFGVPRSVAGFVLPAGYSFNLDGSTLYIVLATLTIAQAAGRHLTLVEQIAMLLTFMLTTKGVAAVPRASLVIIAAGCASFDLPGEAGVAMILAVDELMDMAPDLDQPRRKLRGGRRRGEVGGRLRVRDERRGALSATESPCNRPGSQGSLTTYESFDFRTMPDDLEPKQFRVTSVRSHRPVGPTGERAERHRRPSHHDSRLVARSNLDRPGPRGLRWT